MSDSISIADRAIQAVSRGNLSYCKFLSANDTGETGAHQSGIYIAKNAVPILFDKPGQRGENKDKYVKILWQDDFETDSRFIYYGVGTRDEYRITRFGRDFPFLRPEHTGDLFVLVKMDNNYYLAYILQTDDEISEFLNAFGMSPTDTEKIIQKEEVSSETQVDIAIMQFIRTLKVDFPSSSEMSAMARNIYYQVFNHEENIVLDPDKELVAWVEMEYNLFRKLEFNRYGEIIDRGFTTVEEFIEVANMVLNRRKSRAGKSLEHHLSAIFDGNSLTYESQPRTEGNKRPDFLFPGGDSYHDTAWSSDKLVFLGAKTTCKDRWRQIINEANRIKVKHLFTLQQGISARQLDEMSDENVILVVPRIYLDTYPKEKRDSIWTLKKFISFVKEKTGD
jgi:type II restriction enzyme